jgi:hypothetical protein
MRVAVLANERASFIKTMADGLARMLRDCGATPEMHYDGLSNLMRRQSLDFSSARSLLASTIKLRANRGAFDAFVQRLIGVDLIVVVANVPGSFSATLFPNVEILRELVPHVPIVNYDSKYLPTLDSWSRVILRGEKTLLSAEDLRVVDRGAFGLERYDWYLMASVGTHIPLPTGSQPYSLIGIDLDDASLFPEQHSHFQILLDFAQMRRDYPSYRAVQLEALRLSGVDFVVLDGTYSREEIRNHYRQSTALMLAHAESFGLPICEIQGCGGLVFTPDPHWVTAHWLGRDYDRKREPRLTSNFILYENDPIRLAETIASVRNTYDPEEVRNTFHREQPELFFGDRDELRTFLGRVQSGEIHAELHRQHHRIGRSN